MIDHDPLVLKPQLAFAKGVINQLLQELETIASIAEDGRLSVNDCLTASNEREAASAAAVVRGHFIAITQKANAIAKAQRHHHD